jgi:hypothetical protein
MTGPEPGGAGVAARRSASGQVQERVELVGPHLRVAGHITFGRFTSLADLINSNRGFVSLHDARLLDRAGAPSEPVLSELIVNQDDITFISQPSEPGRATAPGARELGAERGGVDKLVRQFVILTPGYAITGGMHVFREMTLANFVEATDPRFIAVTDAVARPLADGRSVSQFPHLLVNRTRISAIAEVDSGADSIAAAARASSESGSPSQGSPDPAPRSRAVNARPSRPAHPRGAR